MNARSPKFSLIIFPYGWTPSSIQHFAFCFRYNFQRELKFHDRSACSKKPFSPFSVGMQQTAFILHPCSISFIKNINWQITVLKNDIKIIKKTICNTKIQWNIWRILLGEGTNQRLITVETCSENSCFFYSSAHGANTNGKV